MNTATDKHSAPRQGRRYLNRQATEVSVARRSELKYYLGRRNAPTGQLLELDGSSSGLELGLGLLGVFLRHLLEH